MVPFFTLQLSGSYKEFGKSSRRTCDEEKWKPCRERVRLRKTVCSGKITRRTES